MELEDSNGDILNPVEDRDLEAVIDRIGKKLDFCILSSGEGFIQAAGSKDGLIVQYKDSSGQYESDGSVLSAEMVKTIFKNYLAGEGSWKGAVSWSLMDNDMADSTNGGDSKPSGGNILDGNFSTDTLKNTVIRAVKGEAGRGISSMIRKGIRKFLG